MALFEYKAKKSDGTTLSGTIEADDEDAAVALLLEKNYYPLSINPQGVKLSGSIRITFLERVKVKELVVFSRQLAVMSEATVPLVQSLRILVDQTENEKLKDIITDLAEEVDGGIKFSQALSKHVKVFGNFFIAMIRSGETSGRLDEVLNYLADQQEKDYDLMSKVKGAMIYPIFIIFGLIAVGFLMMIFVIPKLTSILTETGAELPLPTKLLISMSDFTQQFWWVIILFFVGLVTALKVALKKEDFKYKWDLLLLKLPIFGSLMQRIFLVRVTRSITTLVQGGVTLPKALEITADVVGNQVYKELILETKKEVEDGNPIASVFIESPVVPSMVSQMMRLGEETGRLVQVLEKLTGFYSREIDNLVTNLVGLIEPLILVIMGVAVGGMVAAVILPLYNLSSSF